MVAPTLNTEIASHSHHFAEIGAHLTFAWPNLALIAISAANRPTPILF